MSEIRSKGLILSKRTRISENFEVTARILELAEQNEWPNPYIEVEAFKDYHMARGNVMADWEAAFRTWLRNAKRFNGGRNNGPVKTTEPKGFGAIRQLKQLIDQNKPR